MLTIEEFLRLSNRLREYYGKQIKDRFSEYTFSPNEISILILLQNNTSITTSTHRMKEGGQFIVDVEPQPASVQMSLKTITTPDGALWWMAFTSFEEELKGADNIKSTFLADIEKIFEAALSVPQIKGIIINPWNKTIMLDKNLIKVIKPR